MTKWEEQADVRQGRDFQSYGDYVKARDLILEGACPACKPLARLRHGFCKQCFTLWEAEKDGNGRGFVGMLYPPWRYSQDALLFAARITEARRARLEREA